MICAIRRSIYTTGFPLIIAFVIAVILMIVAISKFKVHPFLSIMGVSILLAAILKTSQGSSTVAITTTAGIMAPLMETMGLSTPVLAALTVMAIGAGAMTVSHANDSYFWVVTNFGKMTPQQGYKTQTILTLVMGIASIIGIFVLSLFF